VTDMTELGVDWRLVDGVVTAWFDASSLSQGAALAGRVLEVSAEILVDLRPTGVRVRLDADKHADGVSAAGRDLGLAADPGVLQQVSVAFESADQGPVRQFWQGVLSYTLAEDGGLADPLRRDPAIRILPSAEPRPLRHRVHLDVVRPAASVEKASPGEASGPYGLCHADADGNEVDLVPGDPLGEGPATTDWQAVFSAMACYRTTSPTQQRELADAAAALADEAGFPLLVDLRPGLVILDTGKDKWDAAAHGLDLDFTKLAAKLQSAARELGATADAGLPRFVQLFLDAAEVDAVRAFWIAALGYEGTAARDSQTSTTRAGSTRWSCSRRSTRRRRNGVGSATASSSRSRCRRTSPSPAWPPPSAPAGDSSRSQRAGGRSPTPKGTRW
jgi:hypothetical protein